MKEDWAFVRPMWITAVENLIAERGEITANIGNKEIKVITNGENVESVYIDGVNKRNAGPERLVCLLLEAVEDLPPEEKLEAIEDFLRPYA